jgi:peptidoglycan/xylan/chitin deacetylase (PgdA/CDA1 family)
MNDRYFFNIFLVAAAYLLFVTGILSVLMRILLKNGLYVFNYHSFNTLENDYWKFGSLFSSNYQDNFTKQLRFFDKHMEGIQSFALDSIPMDRPRFMLTFDDGYKDNCQIALPVLARLAVPAVFFVATQPAGTDELLWYDKVRFFYEHTNKGKGLRPIVHKKKLKKRLAEMKSMGTAEREKCLREMEENFPPHAPLMMDWEDIRKAHARGIQIGSHSHTHPILTHLDEVDQGKEIHESSAMITKNVQAAPFLFSYPEGDEKAFSQDTVRLLESAGIRFAFTTADGVNLDMSSPYHLKRIGIKASDPVPVAALRIIRSSLIKGKPDAIGEDSR